MGTLSNDLVAIYDLELLWGNVVERVDEPAGSTCPYAVVFRYPLHFKEIDSELALPSWIKRWENRDGHYPVEAGYVSEQSKHAIAGPLLGSPR